MKRTVMTVLLSVIFVIGVVCGVYFLKQAVALRADGESAVASAQETLAAAQTRHDAVDPGPRPVPPRWTAAGRNLWRNAGKDRRAQSRQRRAR